MISITKKSHQIKVKIKESGKLIKTIPYNVPNIIKLWDSVTDKNCYGVEPINLKKPNEDPENYLFYKGTIIEGSGRDAIKFIHPLDSGIGKRQANLYWKLLDKGYKIEKIIELFGKKKGTWVAYYIIA